MTARASKRSAPSSQPSGSNNPKRPRLKAHELADTANVIVIDDSDDEDEDSELKDILAQIDAQEASECLARQLEHEDYQPVASGSAGAPIDVDDDAALARRLAEEWAAEENGNEDTPMGVDRSSDIEILDSGPASKTTPPANKPVSTSTSRLNVSRTPVRELYSSYKLPSVLPDEGLETFREIFTRTRSCTKCKKDVESPRGFVVFSDTLLPPSLALLLHAPCSSCRTNHCRGCFKPLECTKGCKGPSKKSNCQVLDCCADVRAIAIFESLAAFDRQFLAEKAAADSRASSIAKAKKAPQFNSVGPGGTGYGRDGHHTYGNRPNPVQRPPKCPEPSKKLVQWETTVARILTTLVELLPAPYTEDPQVYDMLPHPSIGHIISLSQLPVLLAALLRNDSVTDWISRKETYNAMLLLLRRMADSELTIQCLIGQRWETTTTCGLENWMWQDGEIIWRKDGMGDLEIAPALYTYFKKLTKQSHAFQAGAMQMLGGDASEDVDEMMIQGTSLCGDMIATSDDLERAIAMLGQLPTHEDRDNRAPPAASPSKDTRSKKKGKGRDVSIDIDELYVAECERLAFKHVSLVDPNSAHLQYIKYNYAQHLSQTQMSSRHPKDRLHLLKELAVMATSLPPGVWVRVDDVRNDAIKIMITGPEGTPYAGGLFEFDCFIPIQYPNTPPLMHLRTTGNGTVRFNPNLYNSGAVCLSLLGTWAGRPEEQWSPNSTLLQVLVSIQSMILIDAPYYNEPGHGQANVKAPVSITYNREVSANTVRWAIVDWLKDEHKNGIWRDVIYSHFSIRKDKSASRPIANYGQAYKGSIDLLEEYDKGISIVDSWKIGDEAEY